MGYSIQEIAASIGGRLIPANNANAVEITGVASLVSAGAHDLVFIEDAKQLPSAVASKAAAIIAPESISSESTKSVILCAQPKLAFARAAKFITEQHAQDHQLGVHPTAVVHQNAKIGLGASIGPHSVVHNRAEIGARTRIASGVSVGGGVIVGTDCVIHSNVSIYSGTRLHNRVIVHSGAVLGSDGFGFVRDKSTGKYEKFPQVGRLEIHDDVEVGANTTIDRGALDASVIGRGTKLDNLVHIGHNVQIGENVVIAAQSGISGSCIIGDNAIIAGQVGIADHVSIGEDVILGAQCGVPSHKKITGAGEMYWGTPARPLKQHLNELAAVSQLAKTKSKSKQQK